MNADFIYKHSDKGLCLTVPGLEWLGYADNTIRKGRKRNSKAWPFVPMPEDARMRVLPICDLPGSKKSEISERLAKRVGCTHKAAENCDCGNIQRYASIEPIRAAVEQDAKAYSFYMAYKYVDTNGDEQSLPAAKAKRYANEASILNLLVAAVDDAKSVIKERLGFAKREDFWGKIAEFIKDEKSRGGVGGQFPTSYERLVSHKNSITKLYRANGYKALIHGNYGKQNAAKIDDELSKSMLDELIDNPLQFDDWTISLQYNAWAIKNGKKTITDQTVGIHRRAKEQYNINRVGNAEFREKYSRRIRGKRPSAPLYLVENDDNHLDLLFVNEDDKTQSKYYNRFKAIIVKDSFNDLVLGKMYSENLSVELVKAAYIDAMYYIKSLTGGWYLPFEIKADNWAIKQLEPYYAQIGHFHKTPVGSKGRGYIEQSFGSPHFKRCIKLASNGNYTGNNITARDRGVNVEYINGNRKNYPLVQEASEQIEQVFHYDRHLPQRNGTSKEQQWLAAWQQLPEDKKRPITDFDFLQIFGIEHRPNGRGHVIDNYGVSFQLNNVQYYYDLPEDVRFKNVGKTVTVKYDPFDMSRVFITDDEKLRSVATSTKLMPRAYMDYENGDRRYLNGLLQEAKDNVAAATDRADKRRKVLADNGIDRETIFQVAILDKDLRLHNETKTQLMLPDADGVVENETVFNPFDLA